jgi:ERAP1-like C-terminal domain
LLNLMINLKGDRSALVCDAMSRVFSTIDRLEAEKDRNSFRSFARSVLRPAFDSVGWTPQKGESLDTATLRAYLIWELCALGDVQVQHEGCERFESFLSNPETLDPSLRCSVFSCVGAAGSDQQFQALKDLAMRSTNGIETENAFKGLAGTCDPARLNAILTWTLEGDLAASYAIRLAIWSAQSSVNPQVVWAFLKSHRDEFLRITPLSIHSMVVDLIAENLSDPHDVDDVIEFARATLSPAARTKFEETGQKILNQSSIKKRVIPEMNNWIKANSEAATER